MRWLSVSLTAVMVLIVGGRAGAGKPAMGQPPAPPAPFDHVRGKLAHAKSATIAAACGTTVAPWAYRGPRGDSLELKARIRTEQDERWAKAFATALMRKADWDATSRFRGHARLCRESHDVPLFVVGWHLPSEDVYALIDFEARCARLFGVNRPLGTVWFKDRVDSVFAMVRTALAADSTVAAMTIPPASVPTPDEIPALGETTWVEKLPEVTHKIPPEYPMKAREEGWQGTVKVQALVGKDGTIHDAFVLDSVHGLDDAALACVWEWKFEPAQGKDGPIAVWVAIPVKFTLK
jgi:TonB family protein